METISSTIDPHSPEFKANAEHHRAEAHALGSIAFPSVSTGVYGYPGQAAALEGQVAALTTRAVDDETADCPLASCYAMTATPLGSQETPT